MSKADCMTDEAKFQKACSNLVSLGVLYCVSSLMYDIGQNLEESAKIFDFDYEEGLSWYRREDFEEPGAAFIRDDATLDQLEEIADRFGDWSDVLDTVGYTAYVTTQEEMDEDPDELREWIDSQAGVWKALRGEVENLVYDWPWVGRENGLEPDEREVFEHWVVDSWFAHQLEAHGETVFEFCNMTIWARTTTGQSISQDGVVREIVKAHAEYSWIWEN